jgi:hypothetical protein
MLADCARKLGNDNFTRKPEWISIGFSPRTDAHYERSNSGGCESNLLKHASFSDVELKCTDGEHIPAHSVILAARSKVFKTPLYAKCAEASKSVVALGYHGSIIRSIVKYCYTDHVSRLDDPNEIVQLAMAEDYFGFPNLGERVINWFVSKKEQVDLALTWEFLVHAYGLRRNTSVCHSGMNIVQRKFAASTDVPFAIIHPSLLEVLLTDSNIVTEEVEMFKFIRLWLESHDESSKDRIAIEKQKRENGILTGQKQKEIAC